MTTTTPGHDATLRLLADIAAWLENEQRHTAADTARGWQSDVLIADATGQPTRFGPAVTR